MLVLIQESVYSLHRAGGWLLETERLQPSLKPGEENFRHTEFARLFC